MRQMIKKREKYVVGMKMNLADVGKHWRTHAIETPHGTLVQNVN